MDLVFCSKSVTTRRVAKEVARAASIFLLAESTRFMSDVDDVTASDGPGALKLAGRGGGDPAPAPAAAAPVATGAALVGAAVKTGGGTPRHQRRAQRTNTDRCKQVRQ